MPDPLTERRRERDELIATATGYVEALRTRLELVAAAVAGSVARGAFNVWSDIDVVVIAQDLPARANERAGLLLEVAPARVQPVGYSPEEFALALRRGDRLACEVQERGVILAGGDFFGNAQEPRHGFHTDPASYPGHDLVAAGTRDLEREIESVEALLVSIGAPRLRQLGVPMKEPIPRAEERLYRLLAERHGDAAHSRYNALVRRLVSFERAAVAAGLPDA